MSKIRLRSQNAYWEEHSQVAELLKLDPRDLSDDQKLLVIVELDRRFMQLWDKVKFERAHNLVNYKTSDVL